MIPRSAFYFSPRTHGKRSVDILLGLGKAPAGNRRVGAPTYVLFWSRWLCEEELRSRSARGGVHEEGGENGSGDGGGGGGQKVLTQRVVWWGSWRDPGVSLEMRYLPAILAVTVCKTQKY